jgi:hypothetical protein
MVTLTAVPDAISEFTGWSGEGCSGTGTCVVTMNTSRAVTANFAIRHVATTTTVTSDSAAVTSTYGDSVVFTATVTPGVNVGQVTFIEGGNCASPGTVLQSATAVNGSGQVIFGTSALTPPDHTIVACYSGAAPFDPSSGSIIQTVNKKTLDVTASSTTVTYGDPVPPISAAYAGFVLSQGEGDLTVVPACTTNYTPTSPAGVLQSTHCSGGGSGNYDFNYIDGNVTVNKALPNCLSVAGTAYTYDALPHVGVGACKDLSGLPIDGLNWGAGQTDVPGGSVSWSFTSTDPNYSNDPGGSVTVTINKAGTATAVTCTPKTFPYTGMSITPCSYTVSRVGDGYIIAGPGATSDMSYVNNVTVGSGTASARYDFGGDSNHLGSTGSDTFSITSGTVDGGVYYYLPTHNLGTVSRDIGGVEIIGLPTPSPAPLSPITSAMTANDGTFVLTNFGAGAYQLRASQARQVCRAANGIGANDASLVSQHIVGLITLTPEQMAAGKVAQLATLSSYDAALIAQKVVALCRSDNHAGEWRFYDPAMIVLPDGQMNYSDVDFRAYLLGDVSGDWNPAGAHRPLVAQQGDKDAVWATLPSLSVQPGAIIDIPVRLDNMAGRNTASYQFDIGYDPGVISPARAAASLEGTMAEGLSIAFNASEPGLIKVAVYGAVPIEGDGVYANLRFKVIGATGSSSPLDIGNFILGDGTTAVAETNGQISVAGADNIIRGRVLTQLGLPISNAAVILASTQGELRRVMTDVEGRFQAASLVAGETYTITVQTRLYKFVPTRVSMSQSVVELDLIAVSPDPATGD